MGEKDSVIPADKLQKQELRLRAAKLSQSIRSLPADLVLSEGLEIIEDYSLVIDQILSAGLEGDSREYVEQVIAAHSGVLEALEKVTEHLSTQQRDVMQKMRGILRYLDSLPASISLSGSKKG